MLQGEREKCLNWVVFGRAYHWVISSISKLSTSADVAILVNATTAWQCTETPANADRGHFFYHKIRMRICYFRVDYTLYSTGQWMKWKKDGDEKSIAWQTDDNVCIVNRWRVWKMVEQWLMLITTCHWEEMRRIQQKIKGCAPGILLHQRIFHHSFR